MKVTKHNGRSGKHSAYNPMHKERQFNDHKFKWIIYEDML